MFGKLCCLGISLLIGLHSVLASEDPLASVLNGPATLDQIFTANWQLHNNKCIRTECSAMDDIAVSFDTLHRRDIPNGPALLNPKLFNPNEYNRRVERLLAANPKRRPIYCGILKEIASHYDAHSETTVGRWTIEIAALISPTCARSVVASFPRTEAVDEMFRDAREDCDSWTEPGCQLIVRLHSNGHP